MTDKTDIVERLLATPDCKCEAHNRSECGCGIDWPEDFIRNAAAHISAQAATIELLRAEVRGWRDSRDRTLKGNAGVWYIDQHDTAGVYPITFNLHKAMLATDAANALEGP